MGEEDEVSIKDVVLMVAAAVGFQGQIKVFFWEKGEGAKECKSDSIGKKKTKQKRSGTYDAQLPAPFFSFFFPFLFFFPFFLAP